MKSTEKREKQELLKNTNRQTHNKTTINKQSSTKYPELSVFY